MMNIKNYKCYKNSRFQVLTEHGFRDFKGLIVGDNSDKIHIKTDRGFSLICTHDHKLIDVSNKEILSRSLKIGDILYGSITVIDLQYISNDRKVYELLEVDETHTYISNGILSHQCVVIDEMGHIEPHLMDEFWKSVFPIISSSKKSKIFVCSTANGTDNLFYKLYDGAEKEENGWAYDKILWNEVPGRDEKWAETTKKTLGSAEDWEQEFNCQFLSSGESSIDQALFADMSQQCSVAPIILDEGHYKIWEEPNPDKVYIAGVDISEGVGLDASVIQLFDITDLKDIKQVAVYHNRNIPPLEFSNKLHTILKNWGSPLALIERNNCGAQVVDRLAFDLGYTKVVSHGAKVAGRAKPQMGMIAHTNTKSMGVRNMRYFVNELRTVTFRDIETLKEFKDFVRYPNGIWKAKSGYHDDRVMSSMWALFVLEKEITERYFEIVEVDEHGKPSALLPIDYGVALFEDPTSIYNDFEVVGENNTFLSPIVFGMGDSDQVAEIEWLQQEGWTTI